MPNGVTQEELLKTVVNGMHAADMKQANTLLPPQRKYPDTQISLDAWPACITVDAGSVTEKDTQGLSNIDNCFRRIPYWCTVLLLAAILDKRPAYRFGEVIDAETAPMPLDPECG